MFACADVHTPAQVCTTCAVERVCDDRRCPYTACNAFVTVTSSYEGHRHINMLLYLQAQCCSATYLSFSVDSRGVTHCADNNLLIVRREKESEHKVKSRMIHVMNTIEDNAICVATSFFVLIEEKDRIPNSFL